ncbi:MAG: U32 family peptidase [Chitinispirillaceae bacterium]|nr:U32 family peptidase [Chitinispirillaceae bacterium]
MNRPELLAPAGDFASVDAALDHGADAVYAGIGPFNLRAHAPNFTPDDLPELLERIHARQRKLYVAFNIMPDRQRLTAMEKLLRKLAGAGTLPDAFIVSDPGVIQFCKEIALPSSLHLSTQTGTFNERSLAFWKEQGIQRVILPRELPLTQIAGLAASGLLETEAFIHGAMCVSISGRCLMGAYLEGRHPNRGDCPQPCRWKYRITPVSENDDSVSEVKRLDVEENEEGAYLLNSCDLCTIGILPDIIRSGVTALKIEGRNKSAHYVAAVVKTYRAAMDAWFSHPGTYSVAGEWKRLLESIEHRPYTTGFYTGEISMQEVFISKAASATRIVGVVKALLPEGLPVIDVKNSFTIREPLEILPVNQTRMPFPVTVSRLTDLSGNEISRALSNRLVVAHGAACIQTGDILRRNEGNH